MSVRPRRFWGWGREGEGPSAEQQQAIAQALAARAGALAPLSQVGSKIGFDAHHDNHAEVTRYEAVFARAWASDDLAEGRRAFAERRTPAFRGH